MICKCKNGMLIVSSYNVPYSECDYVELRYCMNCGRLMEKIYYKNSDIESKIIWFEHKSLKE